MAFLRGVGQLSTSLGRGLQRDVAATCCSSRFYTTIIHAPDDVVEYVDEDEAEVFPNEGPPPNVDTRYRSATEVMWPASKHQEKFASRLRNALSRALMEEDALREGLVRGLGFSVKEVRMSPDNLKAFILWDSYLDRTDSVKQELDKRMPRLRSAVGKALGARSVPRLEFRHDRFSTQHQQIEDVFRRLEEEREVDLQMRQLQGELEAEEKGEGEAGGDGEGREEAEGNAAREEGDAVQQGQLGRRPRR